MFRKVEEWTGNGVFVRTTGIQLNFIIMQEEPTFQECPECSKNQKLTQKYLKLIELLKKKNDHSNLSSSIKSSLDYPLSTCLPIISINKAPLPLKLLYKNRQSINEAFRMILRTATQQKCHRGFKLAQTLERCISRRVQEGTRFLWLSKNKGLSTSTKPSIEPQKSICSAILDVSNNPRNISCFVKGTTSQQDHKVYSLSRKLFALNREVEGLRWSKKLLDEQIEQNYRRQDIESKKKKESLQMLAEEMGEKNDLITQLQTALRFYESKQGRPGTNVLQEDGVVIQREIEKIQKINEKLNLELQKRNDHLVRNEEQLKMLNEKLQILQKQNITLKEKNFQMGVQLQGFQKKKKQYYNLSSFIQKKINSLKKYQKAISSHLKSIQQPGGIDKSSFNVSLRLKNSTPSMLQQPAVEQIEQNQDQPSFSPVSRFQTKYKIQKILNYIFNIELEDVWIDNESKLFDNEELQVLNALKLKFIQLNELVKTLTNKKQSQKEDLISHKGQRLSKECGQSDQVYFNQHHVSGSIFEVLNTEKPSKEMNDDPIVNEFQVRDIHKNGESTTRRDNQNFTIKLLQLQIQKNKQIQKISELKNKTMHIRCIVMNLLKHLQFKNLKQEARDIIEVFIELFEYSQQQKELIMNQNRKEKRLWGLF